MESTWLFSMLYLIEKSVDSNKASISSSSEHIFKSFSAISWDNNTSISSLSTLINKGTRYVDTNFTIGRLRLHDWQANDLGLIFDSSTFFLHNWHAEKLVTSPTSKLEIFTVWTLSFEIKSSDTSGHDLTSSSLRSALTVKGEVVKYVFSRKCFSLRWGHVQKYEAQLLHFWNVKLLPFLHFCWWNLEKWFACYEILHTYGP